MTFGSNSAGETKFGELRKRESVLAKATLTVLLLVGAAVFYVWCNQLVVEKGLEFNKVRVEKLDVKKENDRLRLERNTLRNLKRIEDYALNVLGMVHPEPADIRAAREF